MVEAPQSGDVVRVSGVRQDGIMSYAGRIVSDVQVRRILVRDHPIQSLIDASQDAQLLVVGRGGFAGMLLGSTSDALSHTVECPMIVVPSSHC
ncbi:universal stress protein [Nocardia tengchongensis]|uniref:universal stress protein n=1 Tax=Nocardia tengchongensis TaxID=2055889 RepID=UPI0036769588